MYHSGGVVMILQILKVNSTHTHILLQLQHFFSFTDVKNLQSITFPTVYLKAKQKY